MSKPAWNMILIVWGDAATPVAGVSDGNAQSTKSRSSDVSFAELAARDQIPFELHSLDAEQAGELLGYSARYVREDLACRPDFPKRADGDGHPRWIAGELLAWREAIQAGRQARRRRSRRL